jgi:subtilisin family serine protease
MKAGVTTGFLMIWLVGVVTLATAHAETAQDYFQRLAAEGKQRVIIKFTDDIDIKLVEKYCPVKRTLGIIKAAVCEIDETEIDSLESEPGVESVLPDALIPIPPTTRIPVQASRSYGGPVEVRWNHLEAGMNSKAAWDNYDLDGSGIRIAVIDTGIQYNLPDLANHYLGGWDFTDDDGDPLPADANEYHGTEVASIAVAEGVDQIIGTAYQAGFYAIRAGTASGILISNAILGIEWAMDPDDDPETDDGADIINMSFGSYGGDDPPFYSKSSLEYACNVAYSAGIVLVAASGNSDYAYPGWPAEFENVISVGAHSEDQTIRPTSNGGVDVVAPGTDIRVIDPDESIWYVEGTSYAAPHLRVPMTGLSTSCHCYSIYPL